MQQITQRLITRRDSGLHTEKALPELRRTVVVMPFLGTGMGSGHSVLANRYEYLKTCFWSIYPEMPYIVVGVTSEEDDRWCREESGLPFYDVILNKDLPKGASNPVSTVQQVKKRFMQPNSEYSRRFDYMFFTESDQVRAGHNRLAARVYLLHSHFRANFSCTVITFSDCCLLGIGHAPSSGSLRNIEKQPSLCHCASQINAIPTSGECVLSSGVLLLLISCVVFSYVAVGKGSFTEGFDTDSGPRPQLEKYELLHAETELLW